MVVGVVVITSDSLEDRLDNRGDFYRQKSSFKDDIVSLVKNVELYFT